MSVEEIIKTQTKVMKINEAATKYTGYYRKISKKVIGQDAAVEEFVKGLYSSSMNEDPDMPEATFFTGRTSWCRNDILGKTARQLVEQDERPDYFDITQFDEIKNLKLGPCKVSDIPEDIREDVTHSQGFGGNLASGLNYLYEYFEYLHEKGIKIPVNIEEFARLRDARTKEIYPLSLESVKAIGYACKYGSKDYNGELLACLNDFAYIEEVRFQVREMPCDIDDWFD